MGGGGGSSLNLEHKEIKTSDCIHTKSESQDFWQQNITNMGGRGWEIMKYIISLLKFFITSNYVHMWVGDAHRCPGAWVTASFEQPDKGAESQSRVLCKSPQHLYYIKIKEMYKKEKSKHKIKSHQIQLQTKIRNY